jgi:hypothetical protein
VLVLKDNILVSLTYKDTKLCMGASLYHTIKGGGAQNHSFGQTDSKLRCGVLLTAELRLEAHF